VLLDDIIAILSDSKGSLTDALLKTKVLLHQIKKKELATWVTNELAGYPDDQPGTVPDYRVVGMAPHGHIIGYNMQMTDYRLPILHLTAKKQKQLTECNFTDSVASIEEVIKQYHTKSGSLHRPLPPEFGADVKKVLTPGTHVVSAWCEINMLQVESILIQVRSRLLDFALDLKDAVGEVTEKELVTKAATIDTSSMFHAHIYNINTGGGTAIVGSTNIQVNNQQGDIEGLLKEVAKLGYEKAELDELRQAVIDDKSKNETPTVTDGETGKWYVNSLKKVGKGAVKVGVDVATSVIVKALEHYANGGG
jgi:hypothetical protein